MAGTGVYGSDIPTKTLKACRNGSLGTRVANHIYFCGDSNTLFSSGGDGRAGYQRGLIDSLVAHGAFKFSLGGPDGPICHDGDGAPHGTDDLAVDGWQGGASGGGAFLDYTGAPATGVDKFGNGGGTDHVFQNKAMWIPGGSSLGSTAGFGITVPQGRQTEKVAFTGRYVHFDTDEPVGQCQMHPTIRKLLDGYSELATVLLQMDESQGENVNRFELQLAAGSRGAAVGLQCRLAQFGGEDVLGKAFLLPLSFYYPDMLDGGVGVCPVLWAAGQGVRGIYSELFGNATRQQNFVTLMEEGWHTAYARGCGYGATMITTCVVNDRNDDNAAINSALLSSTPEGALKNIQELNVKWRTSALSAGYDPNYTSLVVFLHPQTDFTGPRGEVSLMQPMRNAIKEYYRLNTGEGVQIFDPTDLMTFAEWNSLGYFDVSGPAHMTRPGYRKYADLWVQNTLIGPFRGGAGKRLSAAASVAALRGLSAVLGKKIDEDLFGLG